MNNVKLSIDNAYLEFHWVAVNFYNHLALSFRDWFDVKPAIRYCYGIKITTLDNPGWAIDIRLEGTHLEDTRIFKHLILNVLTLIGFTVMLVIIYLIRVGEEIFIIFQEWSTLNKNN
ncbi:immunity 53 family protein [Paenibacillus alginolyticus]|uniref:Immunity 53 family protein n=1 Tax=Paenibacillus alginolyticus TaxID=59839 RepID=A0ABT4GNX0_9BACL|nr:Imm53 family immunity protein [Paenibacillus alginolyticus]MCY9666328.1 immunity 53 family protein [Paenibacillus alginolyticus]MCY9697920.1 immunity 53 family protein [Paenibacillus alginolyticus]MEC0141790.1 Imm53 family immunity protein [Paenibacillus alginolyticus]